MVTRLVVIASCTLMLAACAEQPLSPTPRSVLPARLSANITKDSTPTSGPWIRIVEGETGPGSSYAVYVPANWNGKAVVYAHGIRDVTSPVDLRDQDGLFAARDQLGAQGYAVAYSSYASNGFAVKDGAQRTHQLRGLLASVLGGQPSATLLVGHSLGALVALEVAEEHPEQYNGALLMCGMVGGSRLQTDYLGNVRALADSYFPGRFAGNTLFYPADRPPVTLPEVIAAVQSNPMGLYAIASTAQTPLPYVPVGDPTNPSSPAFQTMVGSLFGALNFHSRGINDVVDRVHGASPFGNTGITYTLGTPVIPPLAGLLQGLIAQANSNVARFVIDTPAVNYLDKNYEPTGALRIPVLTIHNSWDPGVPAFHETALMQKVQAAGATSMLTQRIVPPGTGHCSIPGPVVMQGFADLATWAASGVKPSN